MNKPLVAVGSIIFGICLATLGLVTMVYSSYEIVKADIIPFKSMGDYCNATDLAHSQWPVDFRWTMLLSAFPSEIGVILISIGVFTIKENKRNA